MKKSRGDNERDSTKQKAKPARRRNDEDGSSGKEVASGELGEESEATRLFIQLMKIIAIAH